jgi:methionine sulfoxide reductase heme-binding subunit
MMEGKQATEVKGMSHVQKIGHHRGIASGQRKQIQGFGLKRVVTHLSLGGMAMMLYVFIALFIPREKQVGFLIIALGYLSLLLICVTLLIGPLNLLRSRRNPVNLDLRRDIGIWAGIAGCWHVALVLRGTLLNGQVLLYFMRAGCCGYIPQLNIFGISNDFGLFATLLLLMLLTLSNTISLRLLKGKYWKRLQRLTYPLAIFAVIHTFGYQYLNLRVPFLFLVVIILIVLVLVGQGLGIGLTLSRQHRRS